MVLVCTPTLAIVTFSTVLADVALKVCLGTGRTADNQGGRHRSFPSAARLSMASSLFFR